MTNRKVNADSIMKRSGILLVTIALIVIMASLVPTAYAGGEENWSESAANFLEGKPINEIPSSLSNPEQARLRNELNSNLLKENTSKPLNNLNNPPARVNGTFFFAPSMAQSPTLNISLKDAHAVPNPVNSGSPVMIIAGFENDGAKPLSETTEYNVSAIIRNTYDADVGKLNLERASAEQYAGMWITNVTAGVYKAMIVASASGASKTFNDALQINVSKAA
jgi:hypothetical protein